MLPFRSGLVLLAALVAVVVLTVPGSVGGRVGATAPPSSPTPALEDMLGDTDCDQDVDAVDALFVLRDVAHVGAPPTCISKGDVQCDGDRDTIDALGILRHVVALSPITQQAGCPPIGVVLYISAGDNFFEPSDIFIDRGEQVTIVVSNEGDFLHNVRIAGVDGKWDTGDDIVSSPSLIQPGETARVVVAFSAAGDYAFQCDFHPADHVGVIHVQ